MAINFCFDSMGDHGLGYPNLAQPGLGPNQFDVVWPRVLPLRLLMYLQKHCIDFHVHAVDHAPVGSWYPIALGWHDFDCDYFALIPDRTKERLRSGQLKVLFYYHEGDHPGKIQQRLDQVTQQHDLPRDCYLFVCSNTACITLDRFRYFNDHEYFFSYINRFQKTPTAESHPRPFQFTALNRVHKWWRASVMADLYSNGLLHNSLWSYNTECIIDDDELDNPLELDSMLGWRDQVRKFIDNGPYVCDHPNDVMHNDHRQVNTDLYLNSYCHLVIETLFDVDGSGGAFLTEKTFKCIKFGQPFVIIGAPGSLAVLRRQGYKVFDHAIDNRYDLIRHNTQRWQAIKQAIHNLQNQDMYQWYLSCLDDVRHNQQVFQSMSHGALQRLAADLNAIQ